MMSSERRRIVRDAREVHRAWFELQARAARGDVVRIGQMMVTHVPGDLGAATIAFPSALGPDTGKVLDEILQWCRDRRPLHNVGCWSGGNPPRVLSAGLLARGFDWGWQPHWMGLSLSNLPDLQVPAGLGFEANPEASVWHAHEHPYYGPSEPGDALVHVRRLAAAVALCPGRLWHVVAWLDARPAGAALVLRVGRVAGVFDVGVPPDIRGRGIGTAVTYAALQIAREHGCTRSALNSTPLGEPVYRKLGYKTGGFGQTFWLRGEHLERPPTDPAQVAFIEAVGTANLSALEAMRSSLTPGQLDAPLPGGLRPVEVAAKLRQPRSVRWLVAHGATLDVSAACELGMRDRVPRMLAERPELANLRTGPEGATALHRAAATGDVELVQWLLDAGADPAIRDKTYNSTAAGWARHLGHAQLADLIESR